MELAKQNTALPAQLIEPAQKAHEYTKASKAKNTKRAYRAAWAVFEDWCSRKSIAPLPCTIETVSLFIADVAADKKYNTLNGYLSAISTAHKLAGHPTPVRRRDEPLHSIWRGIRNKHGAVVTKKAPTLAKHIMRIGKYIDTALVNANAKDRLTLLRDKAILLIGFTGALRRSEIAAIDISLIKYTDEGIVITLLDTKADKEKAGVDVPVFSQAHYCPVSAIRSWIDAGSIRSGFVFQRIDRHGNVGDGTKPMTGGSIATIVKNYASAAGLSSATVSGHSLRRGFGTQMGRNGEPMHILMRHGRWRTEAVAREYIAAGSQFSDDNPTKRLGL